ncbi:MAG TPA: PRTRC system protein E [Mucilaginibacter sp.]|jgi:PRTRC genetic system protein E|nr:PRTRC system protein E [Mucilaginibacter sp.]
MKTNFFQNIADLNVPGNWKIAIHADDKGRFTVSALFNTDNNGDNAYKVVPPMVLKGTAQEMDEGFFDAIEKPVQETAGLFHNMEAYLKGLEEAKKQSKMEQDKKAQELKNKQQAKAKSNEEGIEVSEPKENKEDRKKRYDDAMKQIAELNDRCKYEEAIALLPTVEDYPEKQKELENKLADLTRKKGQLEQAMKLF